MIVLIILIVVNLVVGIGLGILIMKVLERKTSYVGKLIAVKTEDKLVYTLELDVDPEKIQFKKRVFFLVENRDRE